MDYPRFVSTSKYHARTRLAVPLEQDLAAIAASRSPQRRSVWSKRNPQDHACVTQWMSGLDEKEMTELARLLTKALTSVRAARQT